MLIKTLSENLTYGAGLKAEHGLSLYINNNERKILFDTGQSDAFLNNAKILGVDLEEIDHLVISHGHYDHTGGMYDFFKINKKATVYLKRSAIFAKTKGKSRFIGMDTVTTELLRRARFVEYPVEIERNIFVMPDIPVINEIDTAFTGFMTHENDVSEEDHFKDELFLTVKHKNKISVITGCSHRGITNILLAASDHFKLPFKLVLGGFHLSKCSDEQYELVSEFLKNTDVESIGVCHCTGVDKFCKLRRDLGEKVFYNFCGNVIKL